MLTVSLNNGEVEVSQAPIPHRPPGFALLRLVVGGICNTDLELQRGYYGFAGTPGHEFVARVVECERAELRDRLVVGEINLACGKCNFCRGGLARHCADRSVLGILKQPGAFSEFFVLPERNLHVVLESISKEEAVFTEPLAAACEILDQIDIQKDKHVAVLGDGKLGLLVTQVLLAHGARVSLFGRHSEKLRIGADMGAHTFFAGLIDPGRFDIVVECTGSAAGLSEAVAMVEPRGTVVMKSTVRDQVSIDMSKVIVNEITLVGSRCGRFEPALRLLVQKRVAVGGMISARFPLSDAVKAFEEAAKRHTLKVLLWND